MIKNVITYACYLPQREQIAEAMDENRFVPVVPSSQSAAGWVEPREGGLIPVVDRWLVMTLRIDEKVIPQSLITQQVDEQVQAVQANEDRRVGRNERLEIKETVMLELTMKALPKTSFVTGYYNTISNRLLVSTASKKYADVFVGKLIHTLTSVKMQTIYISGLKDGITQRLAQYVDGDDEAFGEMIPAEKLHLTRQGESKESVTLDGLEIEHSSRISDLLAEGFRVEKSGFELGDMSFVLDKDFRLKSIDCAAYEPTEDEAENSETYWAAALLSDLTAIHRVTEILIQMFEYQQPSREDLAGGEAEPATISQGGPDPLFGEAVKTLNENPERLGIAHLQRSLRIGYNRTYHLLEELVRQGLADHLPNTLAVAKKPTT